MSWYDENFKYRYPVAVDVTGGGGTSGNYDVEVVIPAAWDAFWDGLEAVDGSGNETGYDIYPVSNANLPLNFERVGFNFANRTLTMAIDLMAITNNNAITSLWLYWGYAGAANASASRTMTGPKAGLIWMGRPANMIVGPQSFTGGASNPVASFVKNPSTGLYVWFNVRNLLATRLSPYNESNSFEELDYVTVDVLNNAGASQAAMFDENKTRFAPGFVGAFVQAGTNAENYQIKVLVFTTENQSFYLTATLQVRNQLPS